MWSSSWTSCLQVFCFVFGKIVSRRRMTRLMLMFHTTPTHIAHMHVLSLSLSPSLSLSLLSSMPPTLSLSPPLSSLLSLTCNCNTLTLSFIDMHTHTGLYIFGWGSQHWCHGQDRPRCDWVLGGRPCRYRYNDGHIHQELWSQRRIHSSQSCENNNNSDCVKMKFMHYDCGGEGLKIS